MEMKNIFWIGIGLFIGCAEKSPSTKISAPTKTEENGMPKDRAQEIICNENASPAMVKEGISLRMLESENRKSK
jgi:hypothetical protein